MDTLKRPILEMEVIVSNLQKRSTEIQKVLKNMKRITEHTKAINIDRDDKFISTLSHSNVTNLSAIVEHLEKLGAQLVYLLQSLKAETQDTKETVTALFKRIVNGFEPTEDIKHSLHKIENTIKIVLSDVNSSYSYSLNIFTSIKLLKSNIQTYPHIQSITFHDHIAATSEKSLDTLDIYSIQKNLEAIDKMFRNNARNK